MTKSQRVAPVTAVELNILLDRAKVTSAWFCEATGADPRRLRRWRAGSEDIPLWAATFLLAMCTPEAVAEVSRWLAKYREPGRPQPAQSSRQAETAGPCVAPQGLLSIEAQTPRGNWERGREQFRSLIAGCLAAERAHGGFIRHGISRPVRLVDEAGVVFWEHD